MRSLMKTAPDFSARWYFLSLGWAMGQPVFQSLSRDGEFMFIGPGDAVPEAKILVRYYRTYDPDGMEQPPYQLEKAGELGLEFHGFYFPIKIKDLPEKIDGLKEAYSRLIGVRTTGSPEAPLIVLLADNRFDTIMRGFHYYLNMKYMESGGLPIVNLIYCDDIESARNLILHFKIEEKSSRHEERFKTWCTKKGLEYEAFDKMT